MLASPTPEALATSSSALHGDDAPRATAATEFDDEPVAQSAPQAHRFYLKDGNVKFKLDDGMMYNVHRYFFDKHAPSFSHEYLCEGAEGTVALQGVSSTDLDRFLAMVYPSDIGDCDIHTVDEWTSVLRLAVKWSIPNLRARALREIEPRASPVEKVVIGREFALGKAWLLPAFVAICGARECLGYADAARLGLRTVVEIGRIREDDQIHGTIDNLAEAVCASGVLSFASAEAHPSAGLEDNIPVTAVPLDAAASSSAPVFPHTGPTMVDETSLKFTQASTEPHMSISDTASPEGAPASLPAYAETNGSSRLEHEDDTSSLQSHRFFLEDGNVRFQLEDGTLFNVHRYFFKKHAPSFAAEYLQDVAEEPIRLPGITTIDFERFLTMIYPSDIGERDIETVDEWTSVLRLATKWAVPRLRALAIREIEPKATPIEKIVIAREFNLGKDWLLPSFTAICTSTKPLDYEEAERLGLRTVVDIARIREARCRASDHEPKESDFDVASAVLASSVLVPALAADVSPSGDHDPVLDDLSPTTISESCATDIPSSPAGPEGELTVCIRTRRSSSIPDVPSDGDATQGPHAHDTHPTDAESPSHLDAVTSDHFTDESVMPESLLERALLALKLEKEGETEQPVSVHPHQKHISALAQSIVDRLPNPIVPRQLEIPTGSSPDDALKSTEDRLALVIATQLLKRLPTAGSDGTADDTSLSLDDGAVYKIHRYLFLLHCPQFVAQYLQDSSEQIIVLRDVASHDFQRFLSMVYPSEIGGCDIRSVDEWTSILRIATRLSIPSLCARAIREIESTATPIDKVTIAREFNLGDSWFLPAFTAICEADQWLKYEEAERLGLRTVVEIGRIREEQRSA
ncbi:hypothetical protein GGF50DRAFT_59088, partial [Schizophyllum commune]